MTKFFYSMDITGLTPEAKIFLQENLETCHEYSWLVNLDDSDNPNGYHVLYLRSEDAHIKNIFAQLQQRDDYTHFPTLHPIDPDEKSKWCEITPRERLAGEHGE